MIIIQKKLFSEDEKIDISHLPPSQQKQIIRKERKKIELEGEIKDTAKSMMTSRRRANLSIRDNARLGAAEIKRNELAGIASGAASFLGGSKASQIASEGATKVLGITSGSLGNDLIGYGARTAVMMAVPKITEGVGKAVGAVKGVLAKPSAKLKERKLRRLIQERENMEES